MHSCGYLFYWFRRGGLAEVWNETTQWPRFGVNNLAGAIALFVGGGSLALSAHPVIRRKCYSCFYYGHLVGTTVFVLFASAHWTYSVFYFAPATLLWGAELAQRRRQQECAPTIVMASRIRLMCVGMSCIKHVSLSHSLCAIFFLGHVHTVVQN